MRVQKRNKHDMLGAVVNYYLKEKTTFTFPAALATAFGDLKSVSKEIKLNNLVVKQGTKGKVISKDDSQKQLIQTGLVFAGAIYSYAAGKENLEMMTFADINSKSFLKLRDSEVPGFVENILDKADELGVELVPYNIDDAKRALARTRLNDYEEKFASVGAGKTNKTTAGKNIEMLFAKADKLLKVLDKLMLGLKDENPELYERYQASRIIVNKPASHNSGDDDEDEADDTNAANTDGSTPKVS